MISIVICPAIRLVSLTALTALALATATVAEGTVVDLVASRSNDSTTYKPVVRFTPAGGEALQFTSGMGSNPPAYAQGEKVSVFYKAREPQNAMISGVFSLWGGPLILGGLGTVFFLIGGGIMLFGRLAAQREAHLRAHGTPVQAKFQGVEVNRSLTVNGAHPFRVVTQWQDPASAELHIFKSANLWFDPSDHIKAQAITVYIESGNPRKYWVDLSFLPKLAG